MKVKAVATFSLYALLSQNVYAFTFSPVSLTPSLNNEIIHKNRLETFPNDPLFKEQWYLEKIKIKQAWNYTKGSPETIVAVIDSGIDFDHEDFKNQIWTNSGEIPNNGIDDDQNGFIDDVHGWNFYAGDNEIKDNGMGSTGTFYSGIIAALMDNEVGIAGIAPHIRIMPVKFFGERGGGTYQNAINSIDYAINQGADIILTNWGSPMTADHARPLIDAAKRAYEAGVTIIAPVGSHGHNREIYPAAIDLDNVVSVTASNKIDAKPSWANYGSYITIAAPGIEVLGPMIDGEYRMHRGTGASSAITAGAIALIKSYLKSTGRTLSHRELKELLQVTAAPADVTIPCECRIDIGSAMESLSGEVKGIF